MTRAQDELARLQEIIEKLRAPEGCPWDQAQTSRSMIPYLLEEAYEVVETIEDEDIQGLRIELGDLLMHVVMQAQMAREQGQFELADSIAAINEKLVRRHPHVFKSDGNTLDEETILVNWEKAKMAEGRQSRLDGVPRNLSALIRSQRIQEKASRVGFDWNDVQPAIEKLHEELEEVMEAWEASEVEAIEEELGDLLFSVVNVARLMQVDAETALRSAVDKFKVRFRTVEEVFKHEGRDLAQASLEEMDQVWDRIKHQVSHRPTKS